MGIKTDGTVVLLGFHVARNESSLEVARLLRDLKARGLSGHHLQILVADGTGCIQAAARQLLRQAAACYHAPHLAQIQRQLHGFLSAWKDRQPRAIAKFRAHLPETLSYFQLPTPMHRWFRTTNYLERFFRDLRARTKSIGSFEHPTHLEHFLIGITNHVNWIQLPFSPQPCLSADTII